MLRQHLTAVPASAAVCRGEVSGAELGSRELEFGPGTITPANYRFAIGTAGSTGLVLQTVLPTLWTTGKFSRIELEGGTHHPQFPRAAL